MKGNVQFALFFDSGVETFGTINMAIRGLKISDYAQYIAMSNDTGILFASPKIAASTVFFRSLKNIVVRREYAQA